jgi:predicted nucleotidyltransferase
MNKKVEQNEREAIIQKLSQTLEDKNDIIFAYLFGSFNSQESFHDIDIGVFISLNEPKVLEIELELERELGDMIHMPVDVRIMNEAPLSFNYQVIKGGITIVDKNKDMRADFEGLVFKKYFDFQHLRNEYLREVASAPI